MSLEPISIDPSAVQMAALLEFRDEQFRAAVIRVKADLLKHKWWHRLFPFVISIRRR